MKKKYIAFISYRHMSPDKELAIALMESLEKYIVPKNLVKRGFSKTIGKIFIDEFELPTSSDLTAQIQDALYDSEYLIVICSTNTPVSKYVAAEIDFFKKNNGDKKCLTLLVEGEPAIQKIFPDPLTKRYEEINSADGDVLSIEPIAADVRASSIRLSLKKLKTAKLKIIAGLLQCDYDDLVQREHERKIRRNTSYTIFTILLSVTVTGSLLLAWIKSLENEINTSIALSEQYLFSGNHTQAYNSIMENQKINSRNPFLKTRDKTRELLFLSQMIPAYSQYSTIKLETINEDVQFTSDGNDILVLSDDYIKFYAADGSCVKSFNTPENGKIIAVSPDGSRAVIEVTVFEPRLECIVYLCDTSENPALKKLTSSNDYNVQNLLRYDFYGVYNAKFSSDGKYLSVYKNMTGYLSENTELSFWDGETGELLKSVSCDELGDGKKYSKKNYIYDCEVINTNIFMYKGSNAYVYYTPEWDNVKSVSFSQLNQSGLKGISPDKIYTFAATEDNNNLIIDNLLKRTYEINSTNGTIDFDSAYYLSWDFCVLPSYYTDDKKITGFMLVDLRNLRVACEWELKDINMPPCEKICFYKSSVSHNFYFVPQYFTDTLSENYNNVVCSFNIENEQPEILFNFTGMAPYMVLKNNVSKGNRDVFLFTQLTDNDNTYIYEIYPESNIKRLYITENDILKPNNILLNEDKNILLCKTPDMVKLYTTVNVPDSVSLAADYCVNVYKNGYVLALGDNLEFYNDGELVCTKELKEGVTKAGYSSEGNLFYYTSDNKNLKIFDLLSQSELFINENSDKKLLDCYISEKHGKIIAVFGDTLCLYDLQGNRIGVISDYLNMSDNLTGWNEKICFSKNEELFAYIENYTPQNETLYTPIVYIYSLVDEKIVSCIPTTYVEEELASIALTIDETQSYGKTTKSVFISSDGYIIGCDNQDTIKIWDVMRGIQLVSLHKYGRLNQKPIIFGDNKKILLSYQDSIRVVNITTGKESYKLNITSDSLQCMLTPDEQWILAYNQKGMWIIDSTTGAVKAKYLNERIDWACFVDGGKNILYGNNKEKRLALTAYMY